MKKKRFEEVGVYLVIAIALLFALFPIYWTLQTAIKPSLEAYHSPPIWFTENPTSEHFEDLFKMGEIKVQRNSLIVAVSSTILVLIIGSLAGYGFARFKPGGNFLPFWVLSMRMLPPIAFVIPIFLIFKPFQLINTFQGLAIAYTAFNLPYAVWMMKGFFEEIPIELEESALVDGCTRITVFLRIALPLAAAGIIATGIFCFILSWNEFMLALVLMRTKETFTIPVGEYVFYYGPTSGMKWGAASATAILALIPIFVMSVVIQKYLVRGLTFGAIKG